MTNETTSRRLTLVSILIAVIWVGAGAAQSWSWVSLIPDSLTCARLPQTPLFISTAAATVLVLGSAALFYLIVAPRVVRAPVVGSVVAIVGLSVVLIVALMSGTVVFRLFHDEPLAGSKLPVGELTGALVLLELVIPSVASLASLIWASLRMRLIAKRPRDGAPSRSSFRGPFLLVLGTSILGLIGAHVAVSLSCDSFAWFASVPLPFGRG